jgi:NTE family protein
VPRTPRRRQLLAEGPGSVFDGIPAGELERILAPLERRRFPAGAVIVAEGETPPVVYVLQSGTAEIFYVARAGVEHVVTTIDPGGTFGEMSLLTGDAAPAAVRAVGDVEALVIGRAEFERIAGMFPVVYRNVGELLADRLAVAFRLAADEKPGRVTMLRDIGAPPLLSYALAAGIAWHAQVPVMLVLIGQGFEDLRTLAESRTAGADGRAAVDATLVAPEGPFAPDALGATLDELAQRYEHVLVAFSGDVRVEGRRVVDLAGAERVPARGEAELTVRAWRRSGHPTPRPWGAVLDIPPLEPADEEALRQGALPARTPAGRALGWLARDLTGLKVGVAMGAGSLRGWAHYGVLSVLERHGISVDYLAGTSIGAAAAGTSAYGYTAEEGAKHMDRVARWVFRPTVPAYSLLTNAGVGRYLHSIFGDVRMEDLDVPCAIVCADLVSRRKVVLRRGVLWRAVLDSMGIPGIYPAHRIDETVLVDGGLVDPVPTAVCADMGAGVVISVRLTSTPADPVDDAQAVLVRHRPPSMLRVILDSLELMQGEVAEDPTKATSVLIAPDLPPIKGRLRNFGQGRRYFDAGVAAAEAALPRIASALPWLR